MAAENVHVKHLPERVNAYLGKDIKAGPNPHRMGQQKRHVSHDAKKQQRAAISDPKQLPIKKAMQDHLGFTQQDKAEYMKEGKCFRCGSKEHVLRHCPKWLAEKDESRD